MAEAADLRRMALALPGTSEAPHFDRAAFKVDRIYVTLTGDGLTANFKFTPDEQDFKCQLAPEVFAPIDNSWGRHGWTVATLAAATMGDISLALETAHAHAVGKPKPKRF
ncbi:MAG: MmcQ/YjbR family DNA-binding protein [Devosia sp.]|nr:MmcQ/YjbR family DNA-binding protein [Devosia sp.]